MGKFLVLGSLSVYNFYLTICLTDKQLLAIGREFHNREYFVGVLAVFSTFLFPQKFSVTSVLLELKSDRVSLLHVVPQDDETFCTSYSENRLRGVHSDGRNA